MSKGKEAFGTYEIAKLCHVTHSTIGHWIEKGLLPTFTTGGGHRRVFAQDLINFLKQHNIPLSDELKKFEAVQFLIVDDEDNVRKTIKRLLQKQYPQAEIYEAVNGFEAGQKVSELSLTLIILDVRLPGIDGLKVCRAIRSNERLKDIKILAISGYNPEVTKNDSLRAGADDFLSKPFDAAELQEKISRMIDKK